MTVTVKEGPAGDIARAVRDLTSREVLIGIPAETAGRSSEPGDGGLTNAVLGYIHETGAPERNLPARPFLVPGVADAEPRFTPHLRKAAEAAMVGDTAKVDAALHAVGLVGQNAVRARITDGPHTPLAPRTLAERKARGRTGTKPLIDTGQLRRSITYVIRPRGS